MKRLILLCITIIIVSSLLISCTPNYFDNISASYIANAGAESFTTSGGVKTLDEDVILEFTEEELDYLIDYCVIKANDAKNINEIGVFRVENGKTNELKPLIEKYVENLQKTYRAMNYFPEEAEKIDFATVKVFGNYVVYSFLNENDTEAFYNAVENSLKK